MPKKVVLIVYIFSLALFLSNFCYAFDNGDFQYWSSESIEVKFAEKWKIKLEEEFRFGGNAGTFYYNHTDAGVSYPLSEHLEISINYRQLFQKKNKDWDPEYRPHANGTLKVNWQGFAFKDRNRFEYRIKESADNAWRYRNKISVDLPFKWTSLSIQPYAADEIFIDFDKTGLSRNRLYLGFKMKFLKNLKGEIFYLRQSTKGSKWKDCNVLGTKLKLAL